MSGFFLFTVESSIFLESSAISMEISVSGEKEVLQWIDNISRQCPIAAKRAMVRCGLLAVREAKANAPRSPTNKILSSTLKRKKRTSRKTTPGGLEKSIEYEASPVHCSVYVARNSFAGKYAKRIHDEKGSSWRNRGPGTVAKGSRADDKFILRAIQDNKGNFIKIIQSEMGKIK